MFKLTVNSKIFDSRDWFNLSYNIRRFNVNKKKNKVCNLPLVETSFLFSYTDRIHSTSGWTSCCCVSLLVSGCGAKKNSLTSVQLRSLALHLHSFPVLVLASPRLALQWEAAICWCARAGRRDFKESSRGSRCLSIGSPCCQSCWQPTARALLELFSNMTNLSTLCWLNPPKSAFLSCDVLNDQMLQEPRNAVILLIKLII